MTELQRLSERAEKQGLRIEKNFSGYKVLKKVSANTDVAIARGTMNELSFFIQGIEYGRRNVI